MIALGTTVKVWYSSGREIVGAYAGVDSWGYHTVYGDAGRYVYIEIV